MIFGKVLFCILFCILFCMIFGKVLFCILFCMIFGNVLFFYSFFLSYKIDSLFSLYFLLYNLLKLISLNPNSLFLKPAMSINDNSLLQDTDSINLDQHYPNQLKKNLSSKHATLHSFLFFIATKSLDSNLFDLNTFNSFLHNLSFFNDNLHISILFDQFLHNIKNTAKDAKLFIKNYHKNVNDNKKTKKGKNPNIIPNEDQSNDLISALVKLANNKEPILNQLDQTNTANTDTEALPQVKQKRKYTRKPKIESIVDTITKEE